MTVTIRPLEREDLAAAAQLHRRAFPSDPWSKASLHALLQLPGVAGWLFFFPDQAAPAGLLLVRIAAEEAEVLTLAVDPGRRRQGVARKLLEMAIGSLAARGAQRLFLEVAEDNEAGRALYQRLGFRQVGRRPDYYRRGKATSVAALLLERDLVCSKACHNIGDL